MAERIEKLTRRDFPNGIPSYGTDAVRFTYCAMASPGRDINFNLSRVEGYRNFCNKLWNATKFVIMNIEPEDLDGQVTLGLADRWIRARARNLILAAQHAVDTYRFDLYANAVYEFAWHEYCDWYVELAKPVLWDKSTDPSVARGVRNTLIEVLNVLLRTAHPLVPYITDKLWRETTNQHNKTIMHEPFPKASDLDDDPDAIAVVEWLKVVVMSIRNIRGEMDISPKLNIKIALQGGDQIDRERLDVTKNLLCRLAKVETIEWLKSEAQAPPASVQLVGNLKVMVPLEGLIDIVAERERLTKEIKRLSSETERAEAKLANENFVAKAPTEVVQREREKARESASHSETLSLQLKRLDDL
jgi:valyl-tRNA synthetase